jgi:2-isopropylmalate synthase
MFMGSLAGEAGMVTILDSTLREGEQTPGVYFDPHVKMAIVELLGEIGVDIIEVGHPAVSEEIGQGIKTIASRGFRSLIGAHARSLKKDVELALECGVGFIGIFYCVSAERLQDHSSTLITAIDRITEVIAYAKKRQPGLVVRYTPEDTVRSPFENVVAAACEAVRAGADIISVADTTGHMIAGGERDMYGWVSRFREELARQNIYPRIAVHCHNDRGLALANALDGLRAGASIIDASVLGLGERAGIVDLATLLAVLAQDFVGSGQWRLEKIPELYQLVSLYSGVSIPRNFPVVGQNAFTHCAGVHSQAVLRNPRHYQSLDPALFGRKSEIVLDHMSGLSALQHALDLIGASDVPGDLLSLILKKVKDVGQKGRTVSLDELKWIVNYEKLKCKGDFLYSQTA